MSERQKVLLKRLVACLLGGVVLAIMVGPQEGTLTDLGVSFHQAVVGPRVFLFLGIGLIIFLLITYWPLVKPFIRRPGVLPLGSGTLVVVGAQTIMNWYDPLINAKGSGKFNAVRSAVDASSGLATTTPWFFDWLAWTLVAVGLIACGTAVIMRIRALGYLTTVVGVAGAVLAYWAHSDVVSAGGGPDHSLGVYADIIGFLVLAAAGLIAARSKAEVADPKGALQRIADYRPGLPLATIGLIFGLLAFTSDCWFGPTTLNDNFAQSHSDFAGQGLSQLASQYLSWLGWALFAVAALLALAATWRADRILAWLCIAVSIAGVVITFITIHSMTNVGAQVAVQNGGNWKNLGVGGYMACLVFAVFAAAAVNALSTAKVARAGDRATNVGGVTLPVTKAVNQIRTSSNAKALFIVVGAIALFYPPMLPVTWQNVLVVQIGVYVLLAVGLNVVVGWAGLLDLGYIAFYEIGAYTTAYLVGALPRKPPHWLHMTPLLTIPFAILACLIAGVLLGAPTLRLRGDYLAIVTLGFGEIIQIVALNNPGNFTGGAQGPVINHPRIHLFGIHVTWGSDNLPYWYLLLVMLVVVIVLFYRLEGSRLGRAWSAIREDEVAAQASGVNTARVKLLAFAIGASTSALAGTFFATQVGYFDPSLFTLQASILIVAYVVFGGMGSLQGAMAGAAVLTWVPQFLKDQVPSEDRQMWVGALVLAMMIFRPAGLLPAKRRKAELEGFEGLEGADSAETVNVVPRGGAL
ncbi:MAG TPA: branched-chain amino acid ABC transporter permease [Jatrophihabitantaceae bacterium]|nr:branched-chain amino acid ABC transporter permease [Jatrophihabitantaceae bacterium]